MSNDSTPPAVPANTYTCSACHGVFESGWTDEEAQAEALSIFGAQCGPMSMVCDECWHKMGEHYGFPHDTPGASRG